MRKLIFLLFLANILPTYTYAQNAIIEGSIFENNNQEYLNLVEIKVFDSSTNQLLVSTFSDKNGNFTIQVPADKVYVIETNKDLFEPQKTFVFIKKEDKNKKVFTKIKMSRKATFVSNVKPYGIDTKKIVATANPRGVALVDVLESNDPYAEVTNGTRLTDENYNDIVVINREMMKQQRMPTTYSVPPVGKLIDDRPFISKQKDMPTSYDETRAISKPIVVSNQFGETVVALAANKARTRSVPLNYMGYKIEFITSMEELPATHKIFSQHGNITMEQKQNGIYSYLLGSFQNKKEANEFLVELIKPRYPNAKIVYFSNGIRTQKVPSRTNAIRVSAPPQ